MLSDIAILIVVVAGCAYGLMMPGQIWFRRSDDD